MVAYTNEVEGKIPGHAQREALPQVLTIRDSPEWASVLLGQAKPLGAAEGFRPHPDYRLLLAAEPSSSGSRVRSLPPDRWLLPLLTALRRRSGPI